MKKWIKFRWLPASWGLVGEAYAEAEAHYYLEGEALERRLLEIRFSDEPDTYFSKVLDIDLKYQKIGQFEYDIKMAERFSANDEKLLLDIKRNHNRISHHEYDKGIVMLMPEGIDRDLALIDVEVRHHFLDAYEGAKKKIEIKNLEGVEKELALLEVEHDFNKISDNEYEKQSKTLKNEPWVSFIDSGFDAEQGIDGVFFELDWNPQWVEYLKLHGFVGHTDEQIVDNWFSEVCRNIAESDETLSVAVLDMPTNFDRK